jgi:hypothetical protein
VPVVPIIGVKNYLYPRSPNNNVYIIRGEIAGSIYALGATKSPARNLRAGPTRLLKKPGLDLAGRIVFTLFGLSRKTRHCSRWCSISCNFFVDVSS